MNHQTWRAINPEPDRERGETQRMKQKWNPTKSRQKELHERVTQPNCNRKRIKALGKEIPLALQFLIE